MNPIKMFLSYQEIIIRFYKKEKNKTVIGSGDPKKLSNAIKEIKDQGANVVIGPINNEDFSEVKKFNDMIFISPSNMNPEFESNVISIGQNLKVMLLV